MCLGTESSQETLAYFLLDDGMVTRKRRKVLLNPDYRYIGIATAKHAVYGIITVILLAENITS